MSLLDFFAVAGLIFLGAGLVMWCVAIDGEQTRKAIDSLAQRLDPVKPHVSDGTPFCADCGVHMSEWEIKPCTVTNVRVLVRGRG